MFEQCCRANKHRTAIISGKRKITYEELDQMANRLARHLLNSGIKPDDRVAIHLIRSVNTYVSLLAVLKVHAAFVPLDPGFPKDRKHFIMKDADVSAVITTSEIAESVVAEGVKAIVLDKEADEISRLSPEPIDEHTLPPARDNLCYIIYTSGTTGRPKGVAIEHPSICKFVKVAQEVYQYKKEDRVYQGMTIAFDFSIEEICIPLTIGAAIVPGPTDCRRIGPELGEFLTKNKVSVFCCVPTLLATIEDDIPSLRLLIVGGEACSPELVRRWSRPGRRILNTYGPTETTVTATYSELVPGKKVTIGRPLPSYKVEIMDENLRPVPRGEIGEICIGGIGVARGYINRPRLTAEKFIPDPTVSKTEPPRYIYRTGDLGRINEEGEIEFLGRMDTQVKIRGYRIETSEIESVMLTMPDVEGAVVSTYSPSEGVTELAAWFTMKPGCKKDEREIIEALVRTLRQKLPNYMIPAYIQRIDEIPMLPSGKVDRSRLPAPFGQRLAYNHKEFTPPANDLEKRLAAIFARALGLESVSVTDDFFQDLGGHSLVAAKLVSMLRRDQNFSHLGLADIYANPSVRSLAKKLSCTTPAKTVKTQVCPIKDTKKRQVERSIRTYSDRRVWICGVGQLSALLLYGFIFSMPGLFFFKKALFVLENDVHATGLTASYLAKGLGAELLMAFILPILFKRIVLGKVTPGVYPLWGLFFLRWWITERIVHMSPLFLFTGTPLFASYARALGAKIGRNCLIRTNLLHCMDLIEIGDSTSVDIGTHIYAYEVRDGMLILDTVSIGKDCFVGANSVIMPGSQMEDEALLGNQSLLSSGSKIPRGQAWAGSPAEPDDDFKREMEDFKNTPSERTRCLNNALLIPGFIMGIVASVAVLSLSVIPGFAILTVVDLHLGAPWLFLGIPLAGLSFVVSLCLLTIAGKWTVLPRVRPGIYRVNSLFYLRKWFVDSLIGMSLRLCDSLYATLYLLPFLRSLGAKIGRLAEISTIANITPDLLEIDGESFIADAASVGPACVFRGRMRVRPTKIGWRTFVGNSAFVPEGTVLPDECLIGVLSIPPRGTIKPGTTWLGSPPIFLPRRQESLYFPETETFKPTTRRIIERLFFEYFRATGPVSLYFFAVSWVFPLISWLLENSSLPVAALCTPTLVFLAGILNTTMVAAIKWLLMGRYRPLVRPLWSTFVRRTELVTGLYENVVVPALLLFLIGTPFAALVFRLLGAKVGRRCYIETTFMTEFDLVSIGNDCCIGMACSLQTHLFEDRVMKMSKVKLGDACSIGPRAVILYDSVLEDRVRLDALSLVMKGETLPSDSSWSGAPAQRQAGSKTKICDFKANHNTTTELQAA